MRQRECLAFGVMVLIFCLLSLLFIRDAQAADESLTLETYYPAPYGAYAELTTTGNTSLATDTSGSVGIGTTSPQAKLDVDGGIKVGNDTDDCKPQKAGTMRYDSDSGSVQYCNGESWQTPTGGGGVYVGATPDTYNGAGVGGYSGGDAKCVAEYTGSRMCVSSDFANGRPGAVSGWYNTFEAGCFETSAALRASVVGKAIADPGPARLAASGWGIRLGPWSIRTSPWAVDCCNATKAILCCK